MTLTKDLKTIGGRFGEFCGLAFPKGAKIKGLQGVLGLSYGSAEQLAGGGRVPTVAHLAVMARYYGRDFIDFVFSDVASDISDREERLGRFFKAMGEEKTREAIANRAGVDLAVARAVPAVDQLAARETRASALGLVSERLPLDKISLFPALLDHLQRFRDRLGRAEAGHVIATARADAESRIGVVTRQIGDVPRLGYRARTNRLNSLKAGDPITAGEDSAYAALTLKTLAEAEASAEPVLARKFLPIAIASPTLFM